MSQEVVCCPYCGSDSIREAEHNNNPPGVLMVVEEFECCTEACEEVVCFECENEHRFYVPVNNNA